MASLITHYGITKMILDKLGLNESVLYGAILPDIISITGLQIKEDSHYMDAVIDLPHYDRYIENVLKVNSTPVNLGYLFHLIQDNTWYQPSMEFEEKYKLTHEEFIHKLHSDMNILDRILLNRMGIDENEFNSIKSMLKSYADSDIIRDGIDKHFKIRPIENECLYFWKEDSYNAYIEEVLEMCEKQYEEIKGYL
ncbi:MAG: hypothetical protein K6D97_01000 [Clostridia bacterium]|nr:hypothetical protein [Clostridia bacterium]